MKRAIRIGAGEALVLTANRLLDGHIVWRDASGAWQRSIAHAAILAPENYESALENAIQSAQNDGVVGVYEVVVRPAKVAEPVSVRERIRAFGPTVHPQFATELDA
ncbi:MULTISPECIES: DUF2849 domain-containing protein [Asaia]|uniref:DUF2849 domain-containing protein n=1 Tax=Asaia bogorensis NBRC 16594 TaxID=1231624 RepID=A0AAN4U2X1_9PROT|nr:MULTISPECIES: DUF2849 domain-containing protein [Asaia]NIE79909.1 DUF2849 domain-containing protein [Asaia sp. As-1742]BAT19539.1 unknown function DUF2849 domain protein [Asaia bogorensis NBRC 16594]GBQ78466.1 hypothetical protein AA0311_1787 [Asaia bogorensis NBRC 16594]GEL53966.1 hypothetical protein ABO01nite_19730 [Asaia bogorensis NBRC 16594]